MFQETTATFLYRNLPPRKEKRSSRRYNDTTNLSTRSTISFPANKNVEAYIVKTSAIDNIEYISSMPSSKSSQLTYFRRQERVKRERGNGNGSGVLSSTNARSRSRPCQMLINIITVLNMYSMRTCRRRPTQTQTQIEIGGYMKNFKLSHISIKKLQITTTLHRIGDRIFSSFSQLHKCCEASSSIRSFVTNLLVTWY